MAISKSKTVQSLQAYRHQLTYPHDVVIYDNGPHDQRADCVDGYRYVFNEGNIGLAQSYNQALSDLQADDYLVVLDQDTQLTATYFHVLRDAVLRCQQPVFLPIMMQKGIQLSPLFVHTSIRTIDKPISNQVYQNLFAINSGSVYQVSVLNSVNGFDESYPVDYLDHAMFARLRHKGVPMLVLPVSLEHDLSVMHLNQMSLDRYQHILQAENQYMMQYERDRLLVHRLQLLKRVFKQVLIGQGRLALLTIRYVFKR